MVLLQDFLGIYLHLEMVCFVLVMVLIFYPIFFNGDLSNPSSALYANPLQGALYETPISATLINQMSTTSGIGSTQGRTFTWYSVDLDSSLNNDFLATPTDPVACTILLRNT